VAGLKSRAIPKDCATSNGIRRSLAQDEGPQKPFDEGSQKIFRSDDDFEGAHHVVGFVFEDVAVVEVVAGVAFKLDDDAGDHGGWALDDVFPAAFEGFGGDGG